MDLGAGGGGVGSRRRRPADGGVALLADPRVRERLLEQCELVLRDRIGVPVLRERSAAHIRCVGGDRIADLPADQASPPTRAEGRAAPGASLPQPKQSYNNGTQTLSLSPAGPDYSSGLGGTT